MPPRAAVIHSVTQHALTKYQATTTGRTFSITEADLANLDVYEPTAGSLHLVHDDVSYRITVDRIDRRGKTVELTLNGRSYTVTLADGVDQLVERLGFAAAATEQRKDVHAPMPGLVLEVMVAPGTEVAPGDPLMILEAMKMENVLKATAAGVVRDVRVSQGDAVEKKQLLIEIE